jgi:predicted DNA-binding ribbon-helix-helix protein
VIPFSNSRVGVVLHGRQQSSFSQSPSAIGTNRSRAVIKRSVKVGRHKTSITLEKEFWSDLKNIARASQISVAHLLESIKTQNEKCNFSSALRVFVLNHFRQLK